MLWTAFTLGLLGSLHCVGMCGPIALALPYARESRFKTLSMVLQYNFGRITTYMIVGFLIGFLGKGLFLAGLQSWLSVFLGVVLLGITFFSINVENQLVQLPMLNSFFSWVKQQLSYQLKRYTTASLLK